MDDIMLQMDIIKAIDKVLKDHGYDTDLFHNTEDPDFEYSQIAQQIVDWANKEQSLLEELEEA